MRKYLVPIGFLIAPTFNRGLKVLPGMGFSHMIFQCAIAGKYCSFVRRLKATAINVLKLAQC
jgi:hypothetical protein